jgi:CRP/FNR family transcriptional regulator, polysaccharide utilization system transcription regulator
MECVLPTFDVLNEDQIRRINENAYLVTHKKDEVIFRQGKPISYVKFVRKGLVKLYREGDKEKTIIIKIVTAETFLGLLSFFDNDRYQYSASALEESELVYLNANTYREILAENGSYAMQFLKIVSNEAMLLLQKVINVSQKQVTGRLAEVLMFFSLKIYNNNTYTLPVSRMELAELVSTTKESISRTLTEFKNDKIIDIDDKNIVINSPELLQILSKLG